LLVNSESFNNSTWTTRLADATLTHGILDPLGGSSAATLTSTGSVGRTSFNPGFTLASGTNVATSVWLRRRTGTGTVSIYDSGSSQSTATTVTLTSEWQRFSVAKTISYTGTQTPGIVLGTTGDAVDMWGFQFETGSTATPYQRVTTQYDVTEAGVPSCSYLFFDGGSDSMVTSTITPGIDKAQVFAGVRKLSDVAFNMIVESSVSWSSNVGSFFLGNETTPRFEIGSRGNAVSAAGQVALYAVAAPTTAVLSATHDIAGDLSTVRSNGVAGTSGTADKGTGNFNAYPLYIGARAGTSLFFNGNLFSLLVRFGANLDAPTIASTEAYVAGKTGIVI
jgi:hypothetical protein